MNSAVPQSREPIGADSPFEMQKFMESACCAITSTPTPSAVAALNSRAPSTWTGTLCCSDRLRTAAISDNGSTAPPAWLCEVSSWISAVPTLLRPMPGRRTAARSASKSGAPR